MTQKGAGDSGVMGKKRATKKSSSVGARIVEGLEDAVAWTRGDNDQGRVTLVDVPEVDVREAS